MITAQPLRVFLVMAFSCVASTCFSNTLIVPDVYTVQQALDAAATGDTVLIRAGTYAGPFSLAGKDVMMLGESGALSTILDGQNATRVLEIGAGVTVATELKGLTIHRGRARPVGGIRIAQGSGATIRHCSFIGNESQGFEGGPGGGLFADTGTNVVVEDCIFSGNRGGWGIGIATHGTMAIRRCVFHDGLGRVGTAIYGQGCPSVTIESCSMFDNRSWTDGGTVVLYDSSGFMKECTIAFNSSPSDYSAVDIDSGMESFRVERNIISNNDGPGLYLWSPATQGVCNDSWGNGGSNFEPDLTGVAGNFSADPLFCAAATRDFTLMSTSPCLPGQHPAGDDCGRIGAHDAACEATPVLPTTWSRIKALVSE